MKLSNLDVGENLFLENLEKRRSAVRSTTPWCSLDFEISFDWIPEGICEGRSQFSAKSVEISGSFSDQDF